MGLRGGLRSSGGGGRTDRGAAAAGGGGRGSGQWHSSCSRCWGLGHLWTGQCSKWVKRKREGERKKGGETREAWSERWEMGHWRHVMTQGGLEIES